MWCTTIGQRATTFLNQWQWAHLNDAQGAGQASRPTHVEWERPSLGKVKCNVDAAFGDNKVGIGEALGLLQAI
ncbi:hypothetical protein A2U01_0040564 [Trifolium medium]|uniref:Uncharacterized protein n=1 Tax=Trifolium medium TaxID=97028 RepID=A0A392Q5L4_9FABA|nr:hypothetical protein [Trifolium medium]